MLLGTVEGLEVAIDGCVVGTLVGATLEPGEAEDSSNVGATEGVSAGAVDGDRLCGLEVGVMIGELLGPSVGFVIGKSSVTSACMMLA